MRDTPAEFTAAETGSGRSCGWMYCQTILSGWRSIGKVLSMAAAIISGSIRHQEMWMALKEEWIWISVTWRTNVTIRRRGYLQNSFVASLLMESGLQISSPGSRNFTDMSKTEAAKQQQTALPAGFVNGSEVSANSNMKNIIIRNGGVERWEKSK